MSRYVDVGFSNFVETDKIISVIRMDSLPTRRMIQQAKQDNRFIDCTQGKKTRSVIVCQCGEDIVFIGSAVLTSTIINRIMRAKEIKEEMEHTEEET